MKKHKEKLGSIARGYKRAFLFMGIVLIIGAFLGSVYAASVSADKLEETKAYSESVFSGYDPSAADKTAIFCSAAASRFCFLLVIWILGFYRWFIPIIFIGILYKGFNIGFSVGALVRLFGGRGFAVSLSSMLLQNIVFIPFLIAMSVFCIQNSLKTKGIKRRNVGFLGGAAAVCVICGAIEGYLVPLIIQPILSIT